MKSSDGKSQRREEKKKEDQKEKRREKEIRSKRESLRRRKIQVRKKVGKSRNTVFFQWFVAPESRKVGSLKRRVRSQLGRWEMKNCTPLWREAHSQVKMLKAPHVRTTFGSWDVEKVHAVVGRSTFRSQKCKKTVGRGHFWTFRRSDVVSRGRRKGLCTLSKVSKTWGFCSMSESDGRRGTFEEDLQRCIFRGRRSTRDMFIRAVRRSGRWFPKRGCILEHQIFSFGKMILRDRCSTAYDLASLFRGRRSTLDSFRQVEWKNRKTHSYEAVSSALNFPFLKEISQNCFVFDVVNFENWGRLTELLRFWCGQFEKWRKSRRIASFLTLSSSKNEEVSQNCCVFDGVKFKEWGSLSQNSFVFKLADRQIDR